MENGSQLGLSSLHAASPATHFLVRPDHVLVWTCNPQGQCDFVSPSWLVFTGRRMEHEVGSGWLDRVHPEDRDVLTRGLEDAIARCQPFQLVYRYLREDGVFRWIVNQGIVRSARGDGFLGYIGQCFDITSYQEGAMDMELSALRMMDLLRQTRLIAVVLDNEGRVLFSNGGLCRLLQQDGYDLTNARLFDRYVAPEGRGLLQTLYPPGENGAHFPAEFESAMQARSGEIRHVLWHAMTLHEFAGRSRRTILIGDDFTESRREEERLKLSASVVESTDQAVVITDASRNIIAVNHAFTALTGYEPEDVMGKNPRILQSGRHDSAFYEQMWNTLNATGHWRGDIWDRRKDGSIYPKFLSISAIMNEGGEITQYAGIFYEVSERKAIEARLDQLAHYDALTGLPNRCLLLDRLELAAERAMRDQTKVGLLYLDLDHFKGVNDAHGHHVGDSLLQAVARRLKGCLRAVDTVARLGGDEFIVLLPDIRKMSACARVAQKILDVLAPPYDIEGMSIVAMPSIGISIYPDDNHDMEALMRHADAAMYEAKQSRPVKFRFFHEMENDPATGT